MRVFIVAGEPSGDRLGGALMAGLHSECGSSGRGDVSFTGVGGELMQAQGLRSLFPMSELSVMGLAEILPKYRALKARIAQTAQAVIDQKPDVLITIDSPDFSLRVAKLVKQRSAIRTVHYVAPTVWAWRAGRAAKMARVIDHVLALFPFEPPLMTAHGMECDFVGHPVVSDPLASPAEAQAFRRAHDIGKGPLLMVLPGSRRGEVSRLAGPFGQSLTAIKAVHPDLKVVVPAASSVAQAVTEATAGWPVEPIVLDPRGQSAETAAATKRAAFSAADAALAASGTVSLELAASRTPMVIAYKMNWLTLQIMKRMLLIDTVTLVNIVSDTRVVPEFIGADCVPDKIAHGVLQVLAAPTAQMQAMAITMERLGQGGDPPGLRAARAVLARL